MNKLLFALSAIVFALASVTSATAQVTIYSNDFDGETVDERVSDPFSANGQPTGLVHIRAANADFSSQYLELGSRGDNGNFFFPFFNGELLAADPGFAAVTTFKFDAQFTSAEFTGVAGARFRLRAREASPDPTNNVAGPDAARADLLAAEVTSDTVNTYHYVINNTAAAADRPDLTGQIAANTWEIYENGMLLPTESGGSFSAANNDEPITYLTMWLQGDIATPAQSIVRMDNFEVIINGTPNDPVLCGDIDLDGMVTFLDISPFIALLSSGGNQPEADCDMSGDVTFLDINPFIAALAGN